MLHWAAHTEWTCPGLGRKEATLVWCSIWVNIADFAAGLTSWCRMPYLPGYAASSSGAHLFRACLGISVQNFTGSRWQIHKLLFFNEEHFVAWFYLSHQRKYHPFCPKEPVLPYFLIFAVLILFSLLRREEFCQEREVVKIWQLWPMIPVRPVYTLPHGVCSRGDTTGCVPTLYSKYAVSWPIDLSHQQFQYTLVGKLVYAGRNCAALFLSQVGSPLHRQHDDLSSLRITRLMPNVLWKPDWPSILQPWSSWTHTCLLSSWDYRHGPPCPGFSFEIDENCQCWVYF